MKKLFNNRPWKSWKTRKVSFSVVSVLWLVTAILGLAGMTIDSGILDFIYKGGTWLLGFGVTLVISDKVADKLLKRKEGNEDYE